jgi:hypothetical protein
VSGMRIETQIVQRVTRAMHCSKCGVEAAAACDCGVPYVPAGVAAAKAVAAHPEKSDRAIAAEIGVADRTVNRARKATATDVAVESRVGLDGKARKQPARKPKKAIEADSESDIESEIEPEAFEVLDLVEEVLGDEPLNAKQTAALDKIKKRLKRRARDDAKQEAQIEKHLNEYKSRLGPFVARLIAAGVARDLWQALTVRGPCGGKEGYAHCLVPPLVDAIEEALGQEGNGTDASASADQRREQFAALDEAEDDRREPEAP